MISHAVHTVVISFAGLRRLRLQNRSDGSGLSVAKRDRAERLARSQPSFQSAPRRQHVKPHLLEVLVRGQHAR